MSQQVARRETPRRVHELQGRNEPAPLTEYPSERNTRLSEARKDGDHRRWQEKLKLCASLAFLFAVCAIWAVVFLSGQFSPEDKRMATSLVLALGAGLGGYAAGTKRASRVEAD